MSLPFRRENPGREISEINVVPLADVSLVLLIILLLLSPMMAQHRLLVRTAGPPAKAGSPAPEALLKPPPELVLAVSLSPQGPAVGDRLFSGPGEFMDYMRDELSRRADRKVFLAPHPDAPHGLVVHTIETLKSCGAESVALVQTTPYDGQILPAHAAP